MSWYFQHSHSAVWQQNIIQPSETLTVNKVLISVSQNESSRFYVFCNVKKNDTGRNVWQDCDREGVIPISNYSYYFLHIGNH